MQIWQPAYVGVGSNLNAPRDQVVRALGELEQLPRTRCVARSPLYASAPLGHVPQPDLRWYQCGGGAADAAERGAVAAGAASARGRLWSAGAAAALGSAGTRLGSAVFRARAARGVVLTLPHPGIVERNFVLYPLADIAPDLELPGLGRVTELKERVASTGLTLL